MMTFTISDLLAARIIEILDARQFGTADGEDYNDDEVIDALRDLREAIESQGGL